MGQDATTGTGGDVLLLTDSEGNSYLVRREAVEAAKVPEHLRDEVREYVEADTHGYGDATYLMNGITKHWGFKLGDPSYNQNFDLDNDGYIGASDWDIAKKAWYEQNKKTEDPPKVPPY